MLTIKQYLINDLRTFVAHVAVVVVIVEVLDAMTDATMVGTVAVEDMITIAAHLHPTIDVMITDEDLDLGLTHHVVNIINVIWFYTSTHSFHNLQDIFNFCHG